MSVPCSKDPCDKCNDYERRRVKLGKVADCGTCVHLVDSIGNQTFDLLPMIQAGETITSLKLLVDEDTNDRRIRYYPEEYTRTDGREGVLCDICIPDLENTFIVNEFGNVEHTPPREGDTLMFDIETNTYKMFNLKDALEDIDQSFANMKKRVDNIETRLGNVSNKLDQQTLRIDQLFENLTVLTNKVNDLAGRLSAIENAIYNWSADKSTKIPRGTINITSGGPNSNWIIQSRAKNQNEDLNFE